MEQTFHANEALARVPEVFESMMAQHNIVPLRLEQSFVLFKANSLSSSRSAKLRRDIKPDLFRTFHRRQIPTKAHTILQDLVYRLNEPTQLFRSNSRHPTLRPSRKLSSSLVN